MLLELMNDMTQMIARCIAGPGDVGRPDHLPSLTAQNISTRVARLVLVVSRIAWFRWI
jgi:hypothetical protein